MSDQLRELDAEQMDIWSAAVAGAVIAAPITQEGLVMLKPYLSNVVEVSGIDKYCRVALGKKFFEYKPRERAAIVLHECLHFVCNHHQRELAAHHADHAMSNAAQDLEINQMIEQLSWVRLPDDALLPSSDVNVPLNKTMESYYEILNGKKTKDESDPSNNAAPSDDAQGSTENPSEQSKKDDSGANGPKEDSEQSSSSSMKPSDGNHSESDQESDSSESSASNSGESEASGSESDAKAKSSSKKKGQYDGSCGGGDEDKIEQEADSAGVEKATDVDKNIAVKNIAKDLEKELSYGMSTNNKIFNNILKDIIEPPKVNWRDTLKHMVSHVYSMQSYKKSTYSYNRVNRRGSAFMRDVVFPGMIGSDPRISVAVDTSGSMRPNELSSALDEVSGILKTVSHSSKGSIVFFCVDTKMKDVQTVSDPHDLKLSGGGGTNMAPAFRYIKELKRGKRPDVFILITDGGFNWDESLDIWPSQTSVIVLLTKRNELDTLQKLLNGKAKIIDIAD